jgi:hypothetical protein
MEIRERKVEDGKLSQLVMRRDAWRPPLACAIPVDWRAN